MLMREQALHLARSVTTTRTVLLADDSGVDTAIVLAELLHREQRTVLVLAESHTGFTQRLRPSTILVNGMPAGVIATFSVLDQQGIPARLCSPLDLPGCHDGPALALARAWLMTLDATSRHDTTLLICGSPMLQEQATLLADEPQFHCRVISVAHDA